MDQLDPFPEDFCLLPYNQPMSAQALRQTEYCANDIKRRFRNKLHISANMGACLSRQAS